jgi:hypothetical protein
MSISYLSGWFRGLVQAAGSGDWGLIQGFIGLLSIECGACAVVPVVGHAGEGEPGRTLEIDILFSWDKKSVANRLYSCYKLSRRFERLLWNSFPPKGG